MYLLSKKYYNEFKRTGILVRLDFPGDKEDSHAALLIQANTLLLKYIVQNCKVEFLLVPIHDKILYAVRIWDDDNPEHIWSLMEYEEETTALLDIASNGIIDIFLFNECSVCEGFKQVTVEKSSKLSNLILSSFFVECNNQSSYKEIVDSKLDEMLTFVEDSCYVRNISNEQEWKLNESIYITNNLNKSVLSLFEKNEGNQQEQLALWLIDDLSQGGVFHSPKIKIKNRSREFTDLLLVSNETCFLFESKALSIFNEQLPARSKLTKNVEKHIEKALSQLKGTVRQLQMKTPIYTSDLSEIIPIAKIESIHCIIVLSDLSTIENSEIVKKEVFENFARTTKAFLHIVDLNELERIVQAAHMIVKHSNNISIIQAFEFYLIERAKKVMEAGRLDIQVLLKIGNN